MLKLDEKLGRAIMRKALDGPIQFRAVMFSNSANCYEVGAELEIRTRITKRLLEVFDINVTVVWCTTMHQFEYWVETDEDLIKLSLMV